MNYKKYYEDQIGSDYPVFRGYGNQRGHGLGGIFKTLFRFIRPIFETHVLPLAKKGALALGSEAVKTVTNIANDAINGKNVKESVKGHFHDAVKSLSDQAQVNLQAGSGKKRKIVKKQFIVKKRKNHFRRLKDIFDN